MKLKANILENLPDDVYLYKFLGLCTLITMLLYIVFILPQIKSNKELENKKIDQQANAIEIKTILEREDEIDNLTNSLIEKNSLLRKNTQSTLKTNDISFYIAKIADKNNIKLNNIRLQSGKEASEISKATSINLEIVSFVINFDCTLTQYYQFLIDIYSLKTPLTIDYITINNASTNASIVNIDCNLNFYIIKENGSAEDGI